MPKSNLYPSPSRPTEGRLAIVTDAGRDAVDADSAFDEWRVMRTAKSCGPDTPTLVSSLRKATFADDGGKQARSPGRARSKPLKPLRAGMPGDSGATVVTTLVCYQHTAHEAAGATGTRHSPRPLIFGAKDSCTTRAHRAAGSRSLVREGRLLFELNPHASSPRTRGPITPGGHCGGAVVQQGY